MALRTVPAVFPDIFDDFVSSRRVCAPFLLDPVAACSKPLWLGRRAAALVVAFLCAVADAACARSQSSFLLQVLLPTSALRRFLHPVSAPAPPVASCVTLDALSGPSGSDSDDEVWLVPAPAPRYLRLFLSVFQGAVADAPGESG